MILAKKKQEKTHNYRTHDFAGMDSSKVFETLKSTNKGLSSKQALNLLESYGPNDIAAKDKRTWTSILLSQFKSPLILILVFASIIAGFVGERIDSAIIIGIILLNTLLGFYQEFKSEKALSELKKYLVFKARVFRDGTKIEVNVKDLVPGDVVFLEIGDVVPADLRITSVDALSINESVITGESFPISKVSGKVSVVDANASRLKNMAFMGSTVVSGSGSGIVVSTGKSTEFGKTATVLSAREPPTDFQNSMKKFGNFLLKIIFILTMFVFSTNVLLGRNVLDSFLFALALAVGITPELLPIIITIGLSAGAMHLSKKKVVVKKLVAIEDLGNINILCIDKTGTITENNVSLQESLNADFKASRDALEHALLCNSATIEGGKASGNVIDVAVWNNASEKERKTASEYEEVQEISFDYSRRRMSAVVLRGKQRMLVCKGAPESVLEACSMVKIGNKSVSIKKHSKTLEDKFQNLNKQGFRVIAVASKGVTKKNDYSVKDENDLTLLGFLTFMDPPKETAIQSLKKLQELGVEIKVLTGDNEHVTEQVCSRVGLEIKGRVMLGSELATLKNDELMKAVASNNIFARITPEQKFSVVTTLSKLGNVVGFLGDGVNDAPALKAADVGITVDSAVDVAKESADIILLKKSLMVLADGIIEGRKTFGNIIKYIFNTVSANFGNMFTLSLSSLFMKFIPLLPTQILLANLISDGPLMTISTDNVDEDYLKKPKRWNLKMIASFMVFFGLISSIFDFLTMGVLLLLLNADPQTFRTAWFLESVLSEIVITFAVRTKKSFWASKPSKMLVYSSILTVGLTLILIYSPIGFLFEFNQLPVQLLSYIALIMVSYFTIAEIAKKRFYKKHEI